MERPGRSEKSTQNTLMIQKHANHTYTSSLLATLGIRHGYSTRWFGDLRRDENRDRFLTTAGMKRSDLVVGQQVHGIQVALVKDADKGNILSGLDGLVTTTTGIVLGVTFADCVPILAVDPKARVVGTAHAGWKGTHAGTACELILGMKKAGADVSTIYVSIGPHIGMCCYNVYEDRALEFRKKFGQNEKISTKILGEWHVDIGYANYQLLLDSGITRDHIDAPVMCTSCQVSEFNSFRKDPKDKFGVQLGIITL